MISRYPTIRAVAAVVALLFAGIVAGAPTASAQDVDLVAGALESQGYFLESGAFGDASDFERLVQDAKGSDDPWYFVSMAGPVSADFSDELRDIVLPTGNVLVYFIDNDGFEVVQFASNASESVEDAALAVFDTDGWSDPEEFMDDVVRDFDRLTASSNTGSSNTGSSNTGSSGSANTGGGSDSTGSSGGFSLWPIAAVIAAIGGGAWFVSRRSRKKEAEGDLETAQKIRAELQTELDELANDVIVLSSPVDLSENAEAIEHYRQATATYTAISDEIPDIDTLETLEKADLRQLSELGVRVSHARWQMDAAEAMIAGEPIPEKPQIAPPVVETPAPQPQQPPAARPRNLERRQPRPRVPYSRSRRSSGGGLLDILIAGSGMLGGGRRSSRRSGGGLGDIFGGGSSRTQPRSSNRRSSGGGGGVFGGGSSGSSRSRSRSSSGPRSGGGVFGGGSSSSRRSTSRRRSRSSSSRTRSRSSSSRRSTSRRRKRR